MKEHISLELAKWLNERGCEIESKAYYASCFSTMMSPNEWVVLPERIVSKLEVGIFIPAYTWFEVLIDHPDKFFGGHVQEGVHPSHAISYALQEGYIEQSEDIFKKHSIFSRNIISYNGLQFRASQNNGLEQRITDGAWRAVTLPITDEPAKVEWFRLKLSPHNNKQL